MATTTEYRNAAGNTVQLLERSTEVDDDYWYFEIEETGDRGRIPIPELQRLVATDQWTPLN